LPGWHAFPALEIFEMLVDFLAMFSVSERLLHRAFLSLTNDLDQLGCGRQVFEYSGAPDSLALDCFADGQSQGVEVEKLIGGFERHQIQRDVVDIEPAADKICC
jgi:hypothetical protein